MGQPLAGLRAALLGAEGPLGREIAVALTEAGATVTVLTLSTDRQADFAVHSIENELWAIGRSGGAAVVDAGNAGAVAAALDQAHAGALVTHLVWEGAPDVADGLLAVARWATPEKAAVHILGPMTPARAARLSQTAALLSAVRRSGTVATEARINAVATDTALLSEPEPPLHAPPRPLSVPAAVVYLLSPEGTPLRGTITVAA